MKQLKYLLLVITLPFYTLIAKADEGMWLPLLLEKMNEKQMKSLGMKISAKDIYNINKGSLKDAIVSFGGFCTGEVISDKGLVLTNHHCGFSAIQSHSSLEHNYIRDGFWAKNNNEELQNKGLFVTFIVRIEDVSKQALAGVLSSMSESERQSMIDKNMTALRKDAKKESYQDAFVRAFFEGNQYYLFVTETYKDVRLVGAPPSAIGNFGTDTDNWTWPRHTGDFSMFRIYAGKDNKPADYSPDNVPYIPKKSLSISLDGVAPNDFTMVFGFPGRTTEYLPAAAVAQIKNVNDPAKIEIRDKALAIMNKFMRENEQIKIMYASKYASVENSYKKWKGEVLGLNKSNAVEKKLNIEKEFLKRVNTNHVWTERYSTVLSALDENYKAIENFGRARDFFNETMSRIESIAIFNQLNRLKTAKEKNGAAGLKETASKVYDVLVGLYKDFSPALDKQLFISLMDHFYKDQPASFIAPYLKDRMQEVNNDINALANKVYDNETLIQNSKTVLDLLQNKPDELVNIISNHPTMQLISEINNHYANTVTKNITPIQENINLLQRTYMQAQMDVFKEKTFYPDANSTLRVTYGKADGFKPRDGVEYLYYTYLDGVMEKYIPGDYEFDVPEKLRTLYRNKDYGQYGIKGKMPVCFIAQNHTTGGNSGSPALDAWGNLVGLNFDRAWEGTMSDINYDPSICRNIMVDIRYVLFIVDKYAGADRLIKEMKLLHPKKK
ncbi:MAG: S46 family peptidase [Bacteroidetes bacterium]|nr:S46 family peptidase [Bacteroidota bacterium]